MKNLETRTSIRKYAQREVSDELLHRLLHEAERTQTMGNLQLYSVIITRSEEQKAALAPAHFNQPMVKGLPWFLPSVPTSAAPAAGQKNGRQNLATTISCRLSMQPPMPCSIARRSAILPTKKAWAIVT